MTKTQQLLIEAITHVECLHDADPQPDTAQWLHEAKQAAAELERAEPVAWLSGDGFIACHEADELADGDDPVPSDWEPLYRHPPTSAVPVAYEDGLLPCAHCGGRADMDKPRLMDDGRYFSVSVSCDCGLTVQGTSSFRGVGSEAEAEARSLWNQRVSPPTSAVPEGWKLVPAEPTPEMLAEIHLVEHFSEQALQARYKAMLSAAPQPGGPEQCG